MVMRKASITQKDKMNKLFPIWEGLYIIDQEVCKGTYRLRKADGTLIPSVWHSDNLMKYYA